MANRGIKNQGALYLYGISRAAEKQTPRATNRGIDGEHAVQALRCGDFVCWVSTVDHAAFAEALERNKENLEWLALHSVRHQQVVGEVAARTTMVPARFGTFFSGEAALLKDVQGRKSALVKVFKKISDSDEWGVKVFAAPGPKPVASVKAKSGREYLQQKAATIKKRPDRSSPELQEFAHELEKVAAGSAPSGRVSGSQPDLLWQATFLVSRGRRQQWEKVLQDYVERWDGLRRIELSGPWPPYSFVSDAV